MNGEHLKVGGTDVGLQGDVVKRVKNFKHLGSIVGSDKNGRCKEEVTVKEVFKHVGRRFRELYVTESCQQRLRVKCTRMLLDQPCFMEWKLWQ